MANCHILSGWKEVRGISFRGARYKQLDRCFPAAADSKRSCRRGRLEAIGAEGTNGSHAVEGDSRLWDVRSDRLSGSVMQRAA